MDLEENRQSHKVHMGHEGDYGKDLINVYPWYLGIWKSQGAYSITH